METSLSTTLSEWAEAHISKAALTATAQGNQPQWAGVCDKARETMTTELFNVFGFEPKKEVSLFKACEAFAHMVVDNYESNIQEDVITGEYAYIDATAENVIDGIRGLGGKAVNSEHVALSLFFLFGEDPEDEAAILKICEDIVSVVENF